MTASCEADGTQASQFATLCQSVLTAPVHVVVVVTIIVPVAVAAAQPPDGVMVYVYVPVWVGVPLIVKSPSL